MPSPNYWMADFPLIAMCILQTDWLLLCFPFLCSNIISECLFITWGYVGDIHCKRSALSFAEHGLGYDLRIELFPD